MEGDIIVMQDVFVFEQRGRRRGQDPGARGHRDQAEVRREVRDHGHQPAPALRLHLSSWGGRPTVDPLTIGPAGVAAAAILLIAVGIASSRKFGISDRLERYASARGAEAAEPTSTGQGRSATSSPRARRWPNLDKVVEGRDFGANLRASSPGGPQLKPSEYLFIWVGSIVAVPVSCSSSALWWRWDHLSPCCRLPSVHVPASGSIAARVVDSGRSTSSRRHDHAHRRRAAAARRSSRPSSLSCARSPSPDSRPSSGGSSARSTLACRSTRRSRTSGRGAAVPRPFELMATAISIQHQVGGNLAEILDSISYTIPPSAFVSGRDATLTAQQRSARATSSAPPIALAGFLLVTVPGFMEPMFDPPSRSSACGRGDHPHLRRIMMFMGSCSSHSWTSRSTTDGHHCRSPSPHCGRGDPAHRHRPRRGWPVDPVQARLTQLGTMQAKNLEELELQQPFLERTLRPLAASLSGRASRIASTSFTERTEKRLALAGNPGDLRGRRLARDQGHRRHRRRRPVVSWSGSSALASLSRSAISRGHRRAVGYTFPSSGSGVGSRSARRRSC